MTDAQKVVQDAFHEGVTETGNLAMTAKREMWDGLYNAEKNDYYNLTYVVSTRTFASGVQTFITSAGAMMWWAVASIMISFSVTRLGPYAACLTGTKSDNMYVSYNGSCTPADYANEDIAALTFLTMGIAVMFIGMLVFIPAIMFQWGVVKFEPFAQATFGLGFFLISMWCAMFSTYTYSTNKSLDTVALNPVPNVNNTYQPPNYRDLITPNGMPLGIMIVSIIMLIIASIMFLWFLWWWMFEVDSLQALESVPTRTLALNSLVFTYMAVGFAVGVAWQYANPSGSFPSSLVAKQCFLVSVIFFCFGAVPLVYLNAANMAQSFEDAIVYYIPGLGYMLVPER